MSSLFSLAVKRLIQMLGKDWGTPEYDTPVDESQVRDLTDRELDAIYALAGGQDRYRTMVQWAKETQTEQWIEGYDAVVHVGDFERVCSLVKLLDEMWTAALPTTPAELAALATTEVAQ